MCFCNDTTFDSGAHMRHQFGDTLKLHPHSLTRSRCLSVSHVFSLVFGCSLLFSCTSLLLCFHRQRALWRCVGGRVQQLIWGAFVRNDEYMAKVRSTLADAQRQLEDMLDASDSPFVPADKPGLNAATLALCALVCSTYKKINKRKKERRKERRRTIRTGK